MAYAYGRGGGVGSSTHTHTHTHTHLWHCTTYCHSTCGVRVVCTGRHNCNIFAGNSGTSATCSRALQALQSVRRHFNDEGKREQRSNFAPYAIKQQASKSKAKERPRSCTFKMVCLSSPHDDRVPSTAATKEILIEAGLGNKTVTVLDIWHKTSFLGQYNISLSQALWVWWI